MPVSKAQRKSPTRGVRAAGQIRAFLMEDSAKVWPRGRRPRALELSWGPRARGPCRPDAAGQQRAACALAARAGRGAGRLLSLGSSRKLQRRRNGRACVRGGAPAPRVTDAARRIAARRGARVARAERRQGGRVWEVRASAFEVELLPCLNYVRPSVRSGPGAEARPSGGAGGARGPLFHAGDG